MTSPRPCAFVAASQARRGVSTRYGRLPRSLSAAILVAALAFSGLAVADDLMPALSARWIAKDMQLNGLPARIRAVHGTVRLADVLDWYRRRWDGAIDEWRDGDWHVVAARRGSEFTSLRLRATPTGIEGVMTVTADPATATTPLQNDIAVPGGLRVVSQQRFRDRGSQGENLTLLSHRSLAFERQAFVALYTGNGWQLQEDRPARSVADGHVLQFSRAKEAVRVVLYRDTELADGRTLALLTAHSD